MAITLPNYSPFQYCSCIYSWAQKNVCIQPAKTWLDVGKKAGVIALTILSTPPAAVLDLCSGAIFMYRYCFFTAKPKPKGTHIPSPQLVGTAKPKLKGTHIPSPQLVSLVTAPLICTSSEKEFFKSSVNRALACQDEATQEMYKYMLKNGGVNEKGEFVIDIFLWSAGSYLGCSAASNNLLEGDSKLKKFYKQLNDVDKATALLKIMCPTTDWQTSALVKETVQEITAQAIKMTQTEKFRSIYPSAVSEI